MDFQDFLKNTPSRPAEIEEIQALIDDEENIEGFRAEARQFMQKLAPGDRLYFHTSSQEAWQSGMGSEGYALVRNGEIIAGLTLAIS